MPQVISGLVEKTPEKSLPSVRLSTPGSLPTVLFSSPGTSGLTRPTIEVSDIYAGYVNL